MQIFATGWLVASQTKDPSVAALAQTLTQVPVFLFSVLGGVMADRVNTYGYLGWVNLGMAFSAATLAILCLFTLPTVNAILFFTFITATGTALKASAWQASMSSLVEHNEIEAAATLNGLSYNLASVIGPFLGAVFFIISGPGLLYMTNSICLIALVVIYIYERRYSRSEPKKEERNYVTLLYEGLKVSSASRLFRNILLTTAIVFFSVSTFQALLPAYVNLVLQGNSDTLGLLMGGFGAGAVVSAFFLPTLRSLFSRYQILALFAFIYGLFLFVFYMRFSVMVLLPTAFVGGFSWAAIVSTMNSAAQSVFDRTIRARALSVYTMCFYGSLTLGSLVWGRISGTYSIEIAFLVASCLMIFTAFYIFFRRKTEEIHHDEGCGSDVVKK